MAHDQAQHNIPHAKRILVIRAGALGDTAYASSIIEPLRHLYGKDVCIDWVAKAGIGKLFAADPRINKIFELKSRRRPLPFNPRKFDIIRHSFKQPYDLIVNLELGSLFDNVMRLARATHKIGSPFEHFKEPPETHAVENLHIIYRSFMDDAAIQLATPSLKGTEPEKVRNKLGLQQHYIILSPSNSHHKAAPEKNYRAWPIQHWRELMEKLANQTTQVVMIGGNNERDYFSLLEPIPENIISLVGKTNFPDLIGLITGARALITTDTGPAHIASAVNTPVYAMIGPTNYKRTGPYPTADNDIHILSTKLPCSPCYHTPRFTECEQNRCMIEITPERVLQELTNNKVLTTT